MQCTPTGSRPAPAQGRLLNVTIAAAAAAAPWIQTGVCTGISKFDRTHRCAQVVCTNGRAPLDQAQLSATQA